MAFDMKKLNIVADKFGGQHKVWSYSSADDYTASNYFDGAIKLLSVGDLMIAGKTAATAAVDVLLVTSTTTHVTVTKAPKS